MVLRLYDSPLYRDWAAWTTLFMATFTPYAIATGDGPRTMPVWLDTSLATVTFVVLFGMGPAWVRLRRRQGKRWLPAWLTKAAAARPTGTSAQPTWASPQPSPAAVPPPAPTPTPPPPAPTPTPTRNSPTLAHARATLPYPVARAIRALQQAETPRDEYDALLEAAEHLAATVCLTRAALARRTETELLAELRRSYFGAGPTFGTWTVALSRLRDTTTVTPDLLAALQSLKEERNRNAHGDKPMSRPESALRVAEYVAHFERALVAARFLEETPWLCVASCDYRHRTGTFQVVARDATGDHPVFERREYTWSQPVTNDAFYALTPTGPVPLSPFVTYTFCPDCNQMEACYTTWARASQSHAKVQSFNRGHVMTVPDLGDEVRALLDT
ncbi:hypothetical protein [Streptomyces lasiicapitis]|uniref:DUF4145 domain-containing protein n=1 Tax=Streptomyces lasiicapitis TaxID=1923961 RepID=A0ABQ2MEE0_9ACTN|nr:hypothetical protein [Streptomyces lasiicapitis]GGO50281.1 hypothetical protein GCM10012286_50320 [Streptomyces lasiicapitis]